MWPYDYFNQYSSLETELERDRKHMAFIVMWFGDTKKEGIQDQIYQKMQRIIGTPKNPRAVVVLDRFDKCRVDRKLIYTIHTIRSDEIKKGNITVNILGMILEASLIICDITPSNDDYSKPDFSPNVMFELGIAMAWKMPEQVVIICKEKNGDKLKLPFDITTNSVSFIKNYNELRVVIKEKLESFQDKKNLMIKNVKARLEKDSISALVRRNGLMFFESNLDTHTIRYLLNLGVIRTEIFPSRKISFGYCLTEIGKHVLLELRKGYEFEFKKAANICLYPDKVIDMYLVRYWAGYSKAFRKKQRKFKEIHGTEWKQCVEEFLEKIPGFCSKALIAKYKLKNTFNGKLNIFNKYLEDYNYDFIESNTLKKLSSFS